MARRRFASSFKVFVWFPTHGFGIEHLKDREYTPGEVATELEEFCRRIRATEEDTRSKEAQ